MLRAPPIPSAWRCCRALCLVLCMVHASCAEGQKETNAPSRKSPERPVSYSLNAQHSTAEQRIGSELAAPEKQKFVQIELTKIDNPDKEAIIFELFFKPEKQDRVFLGTFSPFPADRPGKFIVATQGRLSAAGTLILSMRLSDAPQK